MSNDVQSPSSSSLSETAPGTPTDLEYSIALQRIIEAIARVANGEPAAIPDADKRAAPHHAKLGASVIAALAASRSEGQQDRRALDAALEVIRTHVRPQYLRQVVLDKIDAARTAVAQPETET